MNLQHKEIISIKEALGAEKSQSPRISVIVPVYKVESYLSECIESILAQTFTDFELILVDDGSPDKSGAICDTYAEKDSRIRVFHKKNGGVSSARNVGIDHARGEYICFFDGDDTVSPKILEEFDKACQGDVEVVVCGISYCDKNLKLRGRAIPRKKNETESIGDFAIVLLLSGIFGYPVNKCFKRAFLVSNNLKFKEGIALAEDNIFVSQCFQHVASVGTISKCLYNYRRMPGSSIHRSNPNIEEIFQTCSCEFGKIPKVLGSAQIDRIMKEFVSLLLFDISKLDCRKSFREKIKIIRWGLSFVPSKKAIIRVGFLSYSTGSPVLLLSDRKLKWLLWVMKRWLLDRIRQA